MLDIAFKYEEELKENLINTWYDDKYKFYWASSYHSFYSCPKDSDGDWDIRQFVSLDSEGNILGLIEYGISRDKDLVSYFGAINFSDNKVIFGMDLKQVLDDIFCKFNFRKIEFSVVVGNPVEKSYDKLIEKYNGHIIGIMHKHVKLIDNQYYDEKLYEIFREDYINVKENRHE